MIYLIGFLLPTTRSKVAGKISFTRCAVAVPLVALAIVSLHLPRAGAFPFLQMIGSCPQPICRLNLANIVAESAKSNRLLQRKAQIAQSRAGRRKCPIIVTHSYVNTFLVWGAVVRSRATAQRENQNQSFSTQSCQNSDQASL